MSTQQPLSKEHPLMQAWERYKASERYDNTKWWAAKKEHTEGSLWAAFLDGWQAAHGLTGEEPLAATPARAEPPEEPAGSVSQAGGVGRFRKKPVVIEAVRYLGRGNVDGGVPDWLWDALESKVAEPTNGTDPFVIHTLEGDHVASPGDWIIRGIKGELYPCKPDIFAATYEPAGDAPEPGEEA